MTNWRRRLSSPRSGCEGLPEQCRHSDRIGSEENRGDESAGGSCDFVVVFQQRKKGQLWRTQKKV
ncbi:hypothetical protein L484_018630 [Morus notabilis]|uniref:Uncharacterized protein n=1 Tax=Morus notabilis TaxID=981085 RepID=W9RFA4_9ROSA|nr:hypothetical protein L484_018630 [Morus notabilis]